MNALRVALVTQRFWPLVGGAGTMTARLAAELGRLGARPIVVTALWEARWPSTVVLRETPVARLPRPRQRGWGVIRYMRSLHRWLRQRRNDLDVVCVSMLKHDAYAALGALWDTPIPVVLRAEAGGPGGDCLWQQTARFGARFQRRCAAADALIAASEGIAEELRSAGYALHKIHVIPNGVDPLPPPSPARRRAARAALAEASPALAVHHSAPVVLYLGRLERSKGVFDLPLAWEPLAQRWPNARLWLIGEGPDREPLYEHVVRRGLHNCIFLPGAFDEVDDILLAADMLVAPGHVEGTRLALLEAMAAGLPVIAADLPGFRALVQEGRSGILTPPGDHRSLSQRIAGLLENPHWARTLGAAGRRQVRAEFSARRGAEQHLELFQRLATSGRLQRKLP